MERLAAWSNKTSVVPCNLLTRTGRRSEQFQDSTGVAYFCNKKYEHSEDIFYCKTEFEHSTEDTYYHDRWFEHSARDTHYCTASSSLLCCISICSRTRMSPHWWFPQGGIVETETGMQAFIFRKKSSRLQLDFKPALLLSLKTQALLETIFIPWKVDLPFESANLLWHWSCHMSLNAHF